MLYRNDRYGNKISQLGFGCMRFTRKNGAIDYEKAKSEIVYAYENGINYFDTAYIYPGSEECLGRILQETGLREKVNVATKLPQYVTRSIKQAEKTFNEELERLRTTYIDYYLMHMFTDVSQWEDLKKLGIEEWINEKKSSGRIRYIGFSFHGDSDMFIKILESYDWDFCQVQYNYMDEFTQAGRRGVERAGQLGIPVVIMEPLRGGKLVDLPDKASKLVAGSGLVDSKPELSFKWLFDQEPIMCVLSGMNSIDMVKENIKIASNSPVGCLDEATKKLIEDVRTIIKSSEKVGCTGCRYCMPCPKGVDIPGNFHYYNQIGYESKAQARFEYARNLAMQKDAGFADLCVGCGKCESHCPQHLPIRKLLKEADKALRPFAYKVGIKVARKIMLH